jgi:DNA topoisomerase-1
LATRKKTTAAPGSAPQPAPRKARRAAAAKRLPENEEAPSESIDEATDEATDGRDAEPRSKRSLVIVESPAKAKTIGKYLGRGFVVKASMGHIRDLPKGKFGIDVERGFQPEYTIIRGKGKVIDELKRYARSAQAVYLAPDMDREGEAIAWHLAESLEIEPKRRFRVVFGEITKKAIQDAFAKPGELDMRKVEAQQARRVLDRIVGYRLSPLLWKKIAKGLSAGRVQSVAVRLIVEREREIRAFVKEEYWRVTAWFEVDGKTFHAELRRLGDKRIEKNLGEAEARALVARIGSDALELVEIEVKPKTRAPTPPFTTSQLQQKAATMLRFSAKRTMMVAQQLYEGVELPGEGSVGLITYMRTDSTRVSDDAVAQVRELIGERFGDPYLPEKPNQFRTKAKGAQEAHEAIRPTDVARTPEKLRAVLSDEQHKLYKLVWEKFVSSQMTPARYNVTTAAFQHGDARFIAQGEAQLFDGHLRVFTAERETDATEQVRHGHDEAAQALPASLRQGERYAPQKLEPTQHFTQPPPRFTEATLVKELEKKGIGRPSTYAAIISTIQDRGYVKLESRRFLATELGEIVTVQLVDHFGDLINTDFTSRMEADLDQVESGKVRWNKVVREFNGLFAKDLEKAEKAIQSIKAKPVLTEVKCDKCGAPMAELYNKRGKFLGCSNYPTCRNTMSADGPKPRVEAVPTDYKCEKCGSPMVIRTGRRGRFLACTAFPKCKSTASVDDEGKKIVPQPTGESCDKCGAPMIVRGSRRGPFLACSAFPKCRNAKPLPEHLREKPKESGEKCEKCGAPMLVKRSRWGKEFLACSAYPACKNARNLAAQAAAEGEEARTPSSPEAAEQDDT